MKISIFGIGYVGAVTAACLVKSGHDVIAVDKDPDKVNCLLQGRAPIIEEGLEELIRTGRDSGRLHATQDCAEAVGKSEMSLICVGTPSRADGSLDLTYVRDVCDEIGQSLKSQALQDNKDSDGDSGGENGGGHIVVLRSTMVPGSALDICRPILERASGLQMGRGFGFGNNPEFLRESTAIYDYFNPPKIVVGGDSPETAQRIMALYQGIDAPRIITEIPVAEGVKYADNAWHAMKVGFANEIGNIFKECGLDSHKVMDIFCQDTKLNISRAYLKPGFAFGGSCLPKDVRAIRALGKESGLSTPLFDALLEANDNQIGRALERIKALGVRHVGLLGLSFKAGTDDVRESPLVILAQRLLEQGVQLQCYDPDVYRAIKDEDTGTHLLQSKHKDVSETLCATPDALIEKSEAVIIGNGNSEFSEIVRSRLAKTVPVIDLIRATPDLETRQSYDGLCW